MGRAAYRPTPEVQFFRDIFHASPIGIAVETLEGQPVFVNPAFCSFLAFSEEELCRKHCVEFSPPEDAEKDWALFQQLRSGSIDHYQLEKRYFRRDGSLVWGQLSISLLNSRPSPLVIAMVEDITERKISEEARFRHAAIVQSSEDAIISKNLDSMIVSWNASAERMFGYREAEVIGRPITLLIPPELLEQENRILENLRAGGHIEHYETTRVAKSGKRVEVSLSISPIKDSTEKLVGFTKIARDITARKQAEQALRAAYESLQEQTAALRAREELLKTFVQNVPAGVAMLDRDMRYLQVSDRFCADYGVARLQLLGCSHYELFPDIPERWKDIHRRALRGETLRAEEDRWDRETGTTWVKWEVRPWQRSDGLPGGILIFAEDITRRKQLEEELSGVSRKLIESQEQDRARIGRELHDDITQRLAILALELHELQRTPSEMQSRLRKLWKHTIDVANDVQALSHELHSSKLEILGVVRSMRSWCREFGTRQGIKIDFKSDVSSVVPIDIGLCLLRVLQEALHNAVKHSAVREVEVRLTEKSAEVLLSIVDAGRGFNPERAIEGKGLGLTSMRERVRLANGMIAIDSKPKHGTTIQVRVPLSKNRDPQRVAG